MFRRRRESQSGGGGGLEDDMTIGSATSVSDRIMGRMKRNLSFGGGGNKNNVSSTGSVSSTKSSGRFGRKKKQSYRSGGDWESVQSAGSRTSYMSLRSRSTRFRNDSNNTTSSVSVTTMEEMDSNESMTLKGISMGRRRAPSAPVRRPTQEEEEGESRVIDEPVEMSFLFPCSRNITINSGFFEGHLPRQVDSLKARRGLIIRFDSRPGCVKQVVVEGTLPPWPKTRPL